MKKYLILPLLLLTGFLLSSCDNTTTSPEPANPTTGSIFMDSSPQGAQIWVDGVNSGKITPDSVTNLSANSHNVTLKLDGYRDTTLTGVDVIAGMQTKKFVQLSSSLSYVVYGPVRIYETAGTTVDQPSGIDLSTGSAYGVSGSNKDLVDIYYSTSGTGGQGYLVQSADLASSMSRKTAFYVGSGTNLMDGVASPLATPSWANHMTDRESNYVFLFDNDLHYSKIIITNWGGGTGPGDPAYVEVKWIYNKTVNDTRFP